MEIQHYLTILWRRKWIIILTLFVTMLGVVVWTIKTDPTYSATTKMRISAQSTMANYYGLSYADRLMNTYVDLATTKPVLDELTQRLGLGYSPLVSVSIIANTELLQITVEDHNPEIAASAANTLAEILINQSQTLYTGNKESSLDILSTQVSTMEQEVTQARTDYEDYVANHPNDQLGIDSAKQSYDIKQSIYSSLLQEYEQARLQAAQNIDMISIVEQALPPFNPIKPNIPRNMVLGFIIGSIGGLGLGMLFENLDTTLYSTDQIQETTNLPIIGKIPQLGKNDSFFSMDGSFAFIDSFRLLRTNFLSISFPIRTLLITSAEPKEGKSRIVANFAYTMAQSGRKVVVIDGDIRIPTQHKLFNVENNIGLSDILEEKTTFTKVLQSTAYHGITVLPSGPLPPFPSELLSSENMKKLIETLVSVFDLVIIDTPAS